MSQIIDQQSTSANQVPPEIIEDFDINKITIDKYDMRKSRSQRSIDDLANDIRQRGQIEYVHIAIIEDKYHLLAGYTRYFALKQLECTTIKAILYKNLSDAEIQSIITATNDFRTDTTTWDRICNIANFSVKNPHYRICDQSKTKPGITLETIYGLQKSILYAYIGGYKFISENEILKEFIENNPNLPTPIFTGIYAVRKLIKTDDDTRKLIDVIRKNTNARQDEVLNNVKCELGINPIAVSKSDANLQWSKDLSKESGYGPEIICTNADNDDHEVKHENTRWRKGETYLKEQLEKIDGVAKVIDVTKQNRGYDLEMICTNGYKYYVEVKTVSSLNEPFAMTDRERSFASNEKNNYIIALVVMSDEEIKYWRYIQNPINKIEYHQVIERVSWKSKNYDRHVSSDIQFDK